VHARSIGLYIHSIASKWRNDIVYITMLIPSWRTASYLLVTLSICCKSVILSANDDVLIRETLKVILNFDLSDVIWKQSTLPMSSYGLRPYIALALSAFLSSVRAASELTLRPIPGRVVCTCDFGWQWASLRSGLLQCLLRVTHQLWCGRSGSDVSQYCQGVRCAFASRSYEDLLSCSCTKPSPAYRTYFGCCS